MAIRSTLIDCFNSCRNKVTKAVPENATGENRPSLTVSTAAGNKVIKAVPENATGENREGPVSVFSVQSRCSKNYRAV